MAVHATMTERAAMRNFVESVHDLADSPSAPNVSRYLRASAELDRFAPKQRALGARTRRSENARVGAA